MRKELPQMWRTVIAVMRIGELYAMPVCGYVGSDEDRMFFAIHGSKRFYSASRIVEWEYLEDILPDYCVPANEKFL